MSTCLMRVLSALTTTIPSAWKAETYGEKPFPDALDRHRLPLFSLNLYNVLASVLANDAVDTHDNVGFSVADIDFHRNFSLAGNDVVLSSFNSSTNLPDVGMVPDDKPRRLFAKYHAHATSSKTIST